MSAALTIERDVAARMRDDVQLRADVWRPSDGQPRPAIVYRAPYDKGRLSGLDVFPPLRAVEGGYVAVLQDTRGRFASEGEWRPIMWEQEGLDSYDTVEWAATQEWCDGNVGMVGPSYLGMVQWLGAMRRPPHLRAIAPSMVTSVEHDRVATGGALRLDHIVSWLVMMSAEWLNRRVAEGRPPPPEAVEAIMRHLRSPDEAMWGLPLEDTLRIRDFPLSLADVLPDGPEEIRPRLRPEEIAVPTLSVSGWYDCFCGPTLALYRELVDLGAAEHELVMGPWAHLGTLLSVQGEVNFGLTGSASLSDLPGCHLRFFDKHLKTAEETYPPVRYFLMGANEWRAADTWPPPGAVEQVWHLRGVAQGAGGRLLSNNRPPGEEPPAEFVYDPADPVPSHGGRLLNLGGLVGGPLSQNHLESRLDLLTYTSEPLTEHVTLAGPVRLALWAESTAPDTDFTAKLLDVLPDGRAVVVADGSLRARYRQGLDREVPLTPGEPARLLIELGDTAVSLAPGHQIRLHISSSNFPHLDRNMNTGAAIGHDLESTAARQRLHHSARWPSSLSLTVLPEEEGRG